VRLLDWSIQISLSSLLYHTLSISGWLHSLITISSICHDLAKQLSHYLYIFFSFLLDLLYKRECGKVSYHKYHKSQSHDRRSHDKCGKVVHRPCSSCISSIGKSNRDSIKFSLSIAEQRAVGFILAWSLAFLHYCRVAFLCKKSDTAEAIKAVFWLWSNTTSHFVKHLHTDNREEYMTLELQSFLHKQEIVHETSTLHVH